MKGLSNCRISASVKLQVLHPMAAMVKKQVFFVRHGESKWNAAKREKNVLKMVRQHDHPINEQGYKQARTARHGRDSAVTQPARSSRQARSPARPLASPGALAAGQSRQRDGGGRR